MNSSGIIIKTNIVVSGEYCENNLWCHQRFQTFINSYGVCPLISPLNKYLVPTLNYTRVEQINQYNISTPGEEKFPYTLRY